MLKKDLSIDRTGQKSAFSKLVYCAHSHYTIDRSKDIAVFVLKKGLIPLDPFLTIPPEVYEFVGIREEECVNTDIKLLEHCDELWIFGDGKTPGVSKETEWWKEHRTEPIKYFPWKEVPCVL